MELQPIAHIRTDYPQKFGIPRQSGLAQHARGTIVFEPGFASPEAVRGIDGFDYLWLIWRFDHGKKNTWSPTVRPPILGGNARMGVFATRSPFRPNPLGLSCVRLEGVEMTAQGPVLHVCGADLRDGTDIYDIKPYLPYADAHAQARGGFTDTHSWQMLSVDFPAGLRECLNEDECAAVCELLALDPRPAQHHDAQRTYAMAFRTWDIHFTVDEAEGVLHVTRLTPRD